MDEHRLRELIVGVKDGRLTRRSFVQAVAAVGLGAPMARSLLGAAGVATAQPREAEFTPTRRGGGGTLRILMWDAPTLLHPHFGRGLRDFTVQRIFYEPLAAAAPDGTLVPVLAEDIPSRKANTLAKDGQWVTWRLKRNVVWHDGAPFTADDVIFNWEFALDPATAAGSRASYEEITRIERLDQYTIKVIFKKPQPYWASAFTGGGLLPRHIFQPVKGTGAREAIGMIPAVGTGPYRLTEFRPGDLIRAELHKGYHVANRPFFDRLDIKCGGDAVGAARAVLQTGEYDFAYYVLIEEEVLRRIEQGGKGRVMTIPSSAVSFIQCNQTDPWREVDGEWSSLKAPHPVLTEQPVRSALSLTVDRTSIQEHLVGRTGQITANFLNAPDRFPLPQQHLGVQHREGQRRAGAGRLPPRPRRGASQGHPAPAPPVSGRGQLHGAEDPDRDQAGSGPRRDRDGGEGHPGLRVLRVRREQRGHQRPLPRRSPDLHRVHRPRSPALHGPVRLLGDPDEGERVERPQHRPLAQRGLRSAVAQGGERDGPPSSGPRSSSR